MKTAAVAVVVVIFGSVGPLAQRASAPPTRQAIAAEAARQQQALAAPQLGAVLQTQTVCSTSPIPTGWIKVNDQWNPTTCGNPSSIVYNVWTIEKYDGQPVGSVMSACSGAVPANWVKINDSWNPTSCGHPTDIVKNVMQIKRLQ